MRALGKTAVGLAAVTVVLFMMLDVLRALIPWLVALVALYVVLRIFTNGRRF